MYIKSNIIIFSLNPFIISSYSMPTYPNPPPLCNYSISKDVTKNMNLNPTNVTINSIAVYLFSGFFYKQQAKKL